MQSHERGEGFATPLLRQHHECPFVRAPPRISVSRRHSEGRLDCGCCGHPRSVSSCQCSQECTATGRRPLSKAEDTSVYTTICWHLLAVSPIEPQIGSPCPHGVDDE